MVESDINRLSPESIEETGTLGFEIELVHLQSALSRVNFISLIYQPEIFNLIETDPLDIAHIFGSGISLRGASIDVIRSELDLSEALTPNDCEEYDNWGELLFRLKASQTVKALEMLKPEGRYKLPDPQEAIQLSLGAGEGTCEEYGMWLKPAFSRNKAKVGFTWHIKQAKDITFIDHDDSYAHGHKQTRTRRYLTGEAVDLLNERYFVKNPNIITAIRFSPGLFQDVERVFSQLSTISAPGAQFIATIGYGNNQYEYDERRTKIEEIDQYLKDQGMDPYYLDLCPSGDRSNPSFGHPQYTNHAILTCQLN
jgi:hypothetical protein